MVLFDAGAFFSQVVADPTAHGFVVSDDSCLDLADNTPLNYLFPHTLRTACAAAGRPSGLDGRPTWAFGEDSAAFRWWSGRK